MQIRHQRQLWHSRPNTWLSPGDLASMLMLACQSVGHQDAPMQFTTAPKCTNAMYCQSVEHQNTSQLDTKMHQRNAPMHGCTKLHQYCNAQKYQCTNAMHNTSECTKMLNCETASLTICERQHRRLLNLSRCWS